MTGRIQPNPHSPYATADPTTRHLFPVLPLLGPPLPGMLALTGCVLLAVVPDTVQQINPAAPPEGLCQVCTAAAFDNTPPPDRDVHPCPGCGAPTHQPQRCAVCRMEAHDEWRATQ